MKLDAITHIQYAFFDVTQACKVTSLDPYADFEIVYTEIGMSPGDGLEHGNIGAFQILKKQHPHLSLALSLGGWTKSTHFSRCAETAERRQSLVASAMQMLERTGFDGIDVDWEYPACCGLDTNSYDSNDWDNYLLLLSDLRSALDTAYPDVHKELTIAMGMSPKVTGIAPKRQLAEVLDCIYLMTYDYNGAWVMLTAHNAPLFPNPAYDAADGEPNYNIEWGVQQWIDVVPRSKLVMGFASYGRSWYGTTSLYGTPNEPGPGTFWEPPAGDEDPGILSYDDIVSPRFADFERKWDDLSLVPYLVGQLEGRPAFITYDDPVSIAIKARYARAVGLAGMMWWEASEDSESKLLLVANNAWQQAPAPTTLDTQPGANGLSLGLGGVVSVFVGGAAFAAWLHRRVAIIANNMEQDNTNAPIQDVGHLTSASV